MPISRRRFISISAAAGGLPLLPFGSARAAPLLRVWTGAALGCDATLQIHHPDPRKAEQLIAASLAEVARLERIMSLYQPESALCRLNRDGVLDDPPFDLVRVLSESRRYAELTGGAFDVTVQPLWNLYAGHFSAPDASADGPTDDALAAAVARVGHEALDIDRTRLRFQKPGMGVTLNGIGQGYITDRVVELLRAGGVEHALVNMGKTRAIGGHPGRRTLVGRTGRSPRARAQSPSAFRSPTGRSRPPAAMALCSTRPAASTIFSNRGAATPVGAGFRSRSRPKPRPSPTRCPTPLPSCRKRPPRRWCAHAVSWPISSTPMAPAWCSGLSDLCRHHAGPTAKGLEVDLISRDGEVRRPLSHYFSVAK